MSIEGPYSTVPLGFWHHHPSQNTMFTPQSGPSWPITTVHIPKSEPCPSPSLSAASSTPRSATSYTLSPQSPHSVCSDDHGNKRVRSSPAAPLPRLGRSLSPQSSTRPDASVQSHQSRARYRAILPAPNRAATDPAPTPTSHSSLFPPGHTHGHYPSHQSSRSRHPASEPPSPYPRGPPFTPHKGESDTPFSHTPTDLPPQKYARGLDTPFRPEKLEGTIPGSMLDMIPALEARFDRLENAIARYAESRVHRALQNSIVEGLEPETY